MRRKRAIVYDDEGIILTIMRTILEERGYEVLTYAGPVLCPINGVTGPCEGRKPCADIVITDFVMPGLDGASRIELQARRNCPIPLAAKAVISGNIDNARLRALEQAGTTLFEKPFDFGALSRWLAERERGMDLTAPLSPLRKEKRRTNDDGEVYIVSRGKTDIVGVAVNTSLSGLCMKIKGSIEENEVVTVRPRNAETEKPALVRWVRDLGSGSYQAGLLYTG